MHNVDAALHRTACLSISSVYYYFYERSRAAIIQSRPGSKALSTLESMLAGLIAGQHTLSISPLARITCVRSERLTDVSP